MSEVLELIERLKRLRPDLAVVPREMTEEMDFAHYCAHTETTLEEDAEIQRVIAKCGGAPAVVSKASQNAWAAAINKFEEGGIIT